MPVLIRRRNGQKMGAVQERQHRKRPVQHTIAIMAFSLVQVADFVIRFINENELLVVGRNNLVLQFTFPYE